MSESLSLLTDEQLRALVYARGETLMRLTPLWQRMNQLLWELEGEMQRIVRESWEQQTLAMGELARRGVRL